MNRCPSCGKIISEYATICPHCKSELNLKIQKEKNIKLGEETNYLGKLVWEIASYLISAVIILGVMIIQETVNKSVIKNLGTNFGDAYSLCQNNLGIFKRFLILLVVFVFCGVGNYYLMKKKHENKKVLRIAIGVIGIVIYTSILVLMCAEPNASGREELIIYIRTLIRTMGMFCGLAYGFMEMTMGYFFSQKRYVMATLEIIVNTLIIVGGALMFTGVIEFGIAGIYNMLVAVAVMIVSIVMILFPKKVKCDRGSTVNKKN
jgi:hypothetical protein